MAKMGSFDISEFIKLRDNLNRMSDPKVLEQFRRECVAEIAMEVLRRTIPKTPVGKKPKFTGKRTVELKLKGATGKSRKRKFLNARAARFEEIWKGYVGGALRRGWTAKTQVEAENGEGDGTEKIEQTAKSLRISKSGDTYIAWIINPIEYSSYVEYGHRQKPGRYVPALGKKLKKSWVQGKHMFQISMQEVEKKLPQLLDRKLQEYLEKTFGGI